MLPTAIILLSEVESFTPLLPPLTAFNLSMFTGAFIYLCHKPNALGNNTSTNGRFEYSPRKEVGCFKNTVQYWVFISCSLIFFTFSFVVWYSDPHKYELYIGEYDNGRCQDRKRDCQFCCQAGCHSWWVYPGRSGTKLNLIIWKMGTLDLFHEFFQ